MAAKNIAVYRVLKLTGILLLFLLMLASFSVYISPHFGWRVDELRSGSMSPRLNTGDLVVTRPIEAPAIAVGDIIVFHAPPDMANAFICHRVIEIHKNSPLSFVTKGDAVEKPDPFVTSAQDVVGIVSFSISRLGHVVTTLQTLPGLLVSLVIPGLLIIWICLKSISRSLAVKAQ